MLAIKRWIACASESQFSDSDVQMESYLSWLSWERKGHPVTLYVTLQLQLKFNIPIFFLVQARSWPCKVRCFSWIKKGAFNIVSLFHCNRFFIKSSIALFKEPCLQNPYNFPIIMKNFPSCSQFAKTEWKSIFRYKLYITLRLYSE